NRSRFYKHSPEITLLQSMNHISQPTLHGTVIIACGVLKAELEAAAQGTDVRIQFLDQALHETPKRMASLIQEKLDIIGDSAKRAVLAYGLCSGGIKGVRAGR